MQTVLSDNTIKIKLIDAELTGNLRLPDHPNGIVIFSHGSGSSRHSPRNIAVAEMLQQKGFATLLFDLLTEEEDQDTRSRFDIALLTQRLKAVTQWVADYRDTQGLSIGYFGASTGAASALRAAHALPGMVKAIVSRGGRPDLAMAVVKTLQVPTLLIVGSEDEPVVQLNKEVYEQLPGEKQLSVVANATHLFPEPGKLEEVAQLAIAWFEKYL